MHRFCIGFATPLPLDGRFSVCYNYTQRRRRMFDLLLFRCSSIIAITAVTAKAKSIFEKVQGRLIGCFSRIILRPSLSDGRSLLPVLCILNDNIDCWNSRFPCGGAWIETEECSKLYLIKGKPLCRFVLFFSLFRCLIYAIRHPKQSKELYVKRLKNSANPKDRLRPLTG